MPRKTSSSESPTVSPSLCHSSQLTTTSSSSPKGRGDSSSYTTSLKQVNPQLQALGELDFKRAFLVLCYIGRNQLEDVAYEDVIREFKYLPMVEVERKIWSALGRQCIPEEDRLKVFGCDTETVNTYHCHVHADGTYTFKNKDGSIARKDDGEPLIHTDGTGFVSEDIALRCPKGLYKGAQKNHETYLGNVDVDNHDSDLHIREPPLLMQVRLFFSGRAMKGTLLVNRKLPARTIQIRPSMIKVEQDYNILGIQSANSLEIVTTSNKPRKTNLSRFLIALLCYGGVPKDVFMNILTKSLEEAQSILSNRRAAFLVAMRYGEMDDYIVTQMISCGIPLDEPYVQHRLSVLMNEERKNLRSGKLPIEDSYHLMGAADPSGVLKNDEVCIILDEGQMSGKVLVYRHPGIHFGDIHILTAIYVEDMETYIGNAKYAILFPTKRHRSLADEMAGGDFDGDMFFVSRNPQLLRWFKPSEPWTQKVSQRISAKKKPSELSVDELEHELFQLFLTTRFNPRTAAGIAADSWLSFMDRLLVLGDDSCDEKICVKKKMLRLVDIYYDALDAPKLGSKMYGQCLVSRLMCLKRAQ
uniref:RNA-dependent RNA polymerase n=1 Tax=Kalanchoe fedtschenkoi TaxID=63787 RepID=A0A7N1A5I7_KALFE